jgi:hypothetical protein
MWKRNGLGMVSSRFTIGQFCASNMLSRMSLIPTGRLQSLDSQWSSTVSKNVSVSPQYRGLVLSWICQWAWYYPLKRGTMPHKVLAPAVFVPNSIKYAIVQEGYSPPPAVTLWDPWNVCSIGKSKCLDCPFHRGENLFPKRRYLCGILHCVIFQNTLVFARTTSLAFCSQHLFYTVPVSSSLIFWRECFCLGVCNTDI